MREDYVLMIAKMKKGNIELYNETLIELHERELSWKEFQELEDDWFWEFYYRLKNKIAIKESPYDIEKLSRAIQNSRSGIGGSAMTKFICGLCGEEDLWGSTAVPKICKDCADEMARNIVLNGFKIGRNV